MDTATANLASAPRRASWWNLRNGFVLLLYVLVALWGFLQSAAPGDEYTLWAVNLFVASVATTWVNLDAQARRWYLPNIVYFVTFLLWPIAVPFYLIRVLGWRGLGWSVLHAIGLYLVFYACSYATYVMVVPA